MPELPEVETTARGINDHLVGKKIADCWTDYNSSFHIGKENIKNPIYFRKFKKSIVGTKITGASRRAKNVLIHLSSGDVILVHMKMTGHLLYGKYAYDKKKEKDKWYAKVEGPLNDPFNRFIRLVIVFSDNSHLVLSDMRKFAKVQLIKKEDFKNEAHAKELGPEPLSPDFNLNKFKECLILRPAGRIKNVLMDQTLIAGIGNIYSDEILWRVGLHPEERVSNIPSKYFPQMYKAMKEVLNKGIDFGGDSMSDYRNIHGEKGKFQEHHQVYQLKGKPCKKKGCKGTIIRKVIGGRSAHFCDTHQKLLK
jgi:formamidopyrimidine-DNA glycosylase